VHHLRPEPAGVPIGGRPYEIVAIGASTGGPPAIERVLADLPRDFRTPIVICQHMPPGFTELWAERLDRTFEQFDIAEGRFGSPLRRGRVYIAPIGKHMRVRLEDKTGEIVLDRDFADSLHVPSIDIMMSSVATAYGSRAIGVLLTGLGSDGALGMLAIRRAGGHTICESKESAVAYSMPGSAIELGAAAEQCPIGHLGELLGRRAKGIL
jgi:two-component system chemotaxis response regulator CheB